MLARAMEPYFFGLLVIIVLLGIISQLLLDSGALGISVVSDDFHEYLITNKFVKSIDFSAGHELSLWRDQPIKALYGHIKTVFIQRSAVITVSLIRPLLRFSVTFIGSPVKPIQGGSYHPSLHP